MPHLQTPEQFASALKGTYLCINGEKVKFFDEPTIVHEPPCLAVRTLLFPDRKGGDEYSFTKLKDGSCLMNEECKRIIFYIENIEIL